MSDVNAPDPGAPQQDPAPAPTAATSAAPDVAPTSEAPSPAPVADAGPDSRAAGPPSVEPPADDPIRRRDKTVGTVIVVVAFVLSLGISLWSKHAARPEVSEPPGPPTSEGVVGFPSAVDVVATLPAARGQTKRPMLRGIVVEGVSSKGTVDVKDGTARVRYTFQSPSGKGAQPPREPGSLPRQHYCGRQVVQIKKSGVVADPDKADTPCPTKHGEPLPDPQCSLKDIWQEATKRGAPGDRLAKIEYYRSAAGPAWRFDITGSKHRFSLYGDCKRELTGADAQNL